MTDRGWLTRNVRVLSAVSFLQDAASELLYPLLPIYLTAVLGARAAGSSTPVLARAVIQIVVRGQAASDTQWREC